MFGNPETTTGGNALKFYSSVRLDIEESDRSKVSRQCIGEPYASKSGEEQSGTSIQGVAVVIMYGRGISKSGEILDLGVEYGIVKAGSWFSTMVRSLAKAAMV